MKNYSASYFHSVNHPTPLQSDVCFSVFLNPVTGRLDSDVSLIKRGLSQPSLSFDNTSLPADIPLSDAFRSIRSRYCQSPSELSAFADSLHEYYDSVSRDLERLRSSQSVTPSTLDNN